MKPLYTVLLVFGLVTTLSACSKKEAESIATAASDPTPHSSDEILSPEAKRKLDTVKTIYDVAYKYKNGNKALAEFSAAKLFSMLKMSPLPDGTNCGKLDSYDYLFQSPLGTIPETPIDFQVNSTGLIQASIGNNKPLLFDLVCNQVNCLVTELNDSGQSVAATIEQDCGTYKQIQEDYSAVDYNQFADNNLVVEKIKTDGIKELTDAANSDFPNRDWKVELTSISYLNYQGEMVHYKLGLKLTSQLDPIVKMCNAQAEYRVFDESIHYSIDNDCKNL